jgi:hypothetical protein
LCCGCSKIGFSAQVSAENMIGLQESTKCALITKVTSTTFKSRDEKFLLSCVKTSGLAVFFQCGICFSTETDLCAI